MALQTLPFTTLDVFTSTPFLGNPVALLHVPAALSATLTQTQKQLIAREFNLSETVFVHERTSEDTQHGNVRIDIFTPIAEVPFAGHPTIGTSNWLLRFASDSAAVAGGRQREEDNEELALVTKAGRIPIRLAEGGDAVRIDVAHNVHVHDAPFAGEQYAKYPVVSIVKGMTFILAELGSLEELGRQTANLVGTANTYTKQGLLDEGWQEGIVVSYFYVHNGVDMKGVRLLRTRSFGSREDPNTGSAASALASWLSLNEAKEERVLRYQVTQGVEMGRKGDIFVEVTRTEDGKGIERVVLSGTAVKVMEGQVVVPAAAAE